MGLFMGLSQGLCKSTSAAKKREEGSGIEEDRGMKETCKRYQLCAGNRSERNKREYSKRHPSSYSYFT